MSTEQILKKWNTGDALPSLPIAIRRIGHANDTQLLIEDTNGTIINSWEGLELLQVTYDFEADNEGFTTGTNTAGTQDLQYTFLTPMEV